MKKLLFCAVLAIGLAASVNQAQAQGCAPSKTYYQSSGAQPLYVGKLDTVSNTGTDTFKMALACKPTSITFQENFTKISGTLGGTVTLYESIDGVNYVALGSAYTVTNSTAQSNTYLVSGGNPYTNYWLVWTGTGTMSGSWQGLVLIR